MMNVNVLRLDHRIGRDTRITTHVCLTSRAFGASKIYLSGEEDHKLMENVRDTADRWGGNFEIEYAKNYMGVINKWKLCWRSSSKAHRRVRRMPVQRTFPFRSPEMHCPFSLPYAPVALLRRSQEAEYRT